MWVLDKFMWVESGSPCQDSPFPLEFVGGYPRETSGSGKPTRIAFFVAGPTLWMPQDITRHLLGGPSWLLIDRCLNAAFEAFNTYRSRKTSSLTFTTNKIVVIRSVFRNFQKSRSLVPDVLRIFIRWKGPRSTLIPRTARKAASIF